MGFWLSLKRLPFIGEVCYIALHYIVLYTTFCPRAGLPPQTEESRLQLYQGLNRCDSPTLHSTLYYYYIILQYGILYLLQFITLGSTSYITLHYIGGKGDWDLRISDLVKNRDGTDI